MTEPTSGFAPCTKLLSKLHTFLHCKRMETNLQDRCLSNTHFCTFKTYPYQKATKKIMGDSQTLIVLYLYSLSILARQRIKAIFTLLISPSVYRHLFLAQSSLCILLICYGWSPQPTPALWDFQYMTIRVGIYPSSETKKDI